MSERKGQQRAIIVQLRWVLWSQGARSRSTRYLQIIADGNLERIRRLFSNL